MADHLFDRLRFSYNSWHFDLVRDKLRTRKRPLQYVFNDMSTHELCRQLRRNRNWKDTYNSWMLNELEDNVVSLILMGRIEYPHLFGPGQWPWSQDWEGFRSRPKGHLGNIAFPFSCLFKYKFSSSMFPKQQTHTSDLELYLGFFFWLCFWCLEP